MSPLGCPSKAFLGKQPRCAFYAIRPPNPQSRAGGGACQSHGARELQRGLDLPIGGVSEIYSGSTGADKIEVSASSGAEPKSASSVASSRTGAFLQCSGAVTSISANRPSSFLMFAYAPISIMYALKVPVTLLCVRAEPTYGSKITRFSKIGVRKRTDARDRGCASSRDTPSDVPNQATKRDSASAAAYFPPRSRLHSG